jgi:hypothetical protein
MKEIIITTTEQPLVEINTETEKEAVFSTKINKDVLITAQEQKPIEITTK